MNQTSRVVVITGGSGGLGDALARCHLSAGDDVIITSRTLSSRSAAQKQNGHPRFHAYPLDVRDREAAQAFADWVQDRFGRCDILYNNAGVAVFKPFAEMSPTEIDEVFDVNVNGVVYVTRAFLPMMLAAGRGQIVNVASLAGRVATAKAAVYAASKAAVIRFSEGLRHELSGSGISVTCVLPGPIDTPLLRRADPSGAYRDKASHYLLFPEKTAEIIVRAVEAKRAEVALPLRLHLLSLLYPLLPEQLREWLAPLVNRK